MNQTLSSKDGLIVGSGDRVADLSKVGPLGLLVGIVCAAVLGVLYSSHQIEVSASWMFGWYFWLTITMGMFGLSIITHTIRPTWAVSLLRLFESGGGPISILTIGLLFLPIVVAPANVYEWANPLRVQADVILRHKAPYLNVPAWSIRYLIFFAIWFAFSMFMKRSVRRQEAMTDVEAGRKLEMGRSSWGAVGVLMFFLTYTFGLIDWSMSLNAHWASTMFGLWQIIASGLGAMSFCVVLACLNAKREPYTQIISPNLTKDWGNILFMLTMLWAYTAISQFLIIWNGNLPDVAQYYARRTMMMWNAIGMVTILGQFLVPWMSLLSPRVKRYPRLLRQIAGWIFVIHIVDVYLAIGPDLPSAGVAVGTAYRAAGESIGLDALAFFAVGGIWLWTFASQVKQAPLLVSYDHRLQEALHAH